MTITVQQADPSDPCFPGAEHHLEKPWGHWLWKPVVPVCNLSQESLHFSPKNFISSLITALGVFPLPVCYSHVYISSVGHTYSCG